MSWPPPLGPHSLQAPRPRPSIPWAESALSSGLSSAPLPLRPVAPLALAGSPHCLVPPDARMSKCPPGSGRTAGRAGAPQVQMPRLFHRQEGASGPSPGTPCPGAAGGRGGGRPEMGRSLVRAAEMQRGGRSDPGPQGDPGPSVPPTRIGRMCAEQCASAGCTSGLTPWLSAFPTPRPRGHSPVSSGSHSSPGAVVTGPGARVLARPCCRKLLAGTHLPSASP